MESNADRFRFVGWPERPRGGSMENPYRVYCKRVGPDGSLPPCHCKGDWCVASDKLDRGAAK